MTKRSTYTISSGNNPLGTIIGIVLLIAVFYFLFKLASFVFWLLWQVSPIMLIAALVIDYRLVWQHVQWIAGLFRTNVVMGLLTTAFTVFGFPLVVLYLLGRALLNRRIRQAQDMAKRQEEGELVDYEELDSEPLDLPSPQPRTARKDDDTNKYGQMFED